MSEREVLKTAYALATGDKLSDLVLFNDIGTRLGVPTGEVEALAAELVRRVHCVAAPSGITLTEAGVAEARRW